jgi:hypothetical protein
MTWDSGFGSHPTVTLPDPLVVWLDAGNTETSDASRIDDRDDGTEILRAEGCRGSTPQALERSKKNLKIN